MERGRFLPGVAQIPVSLIGGTPSREPISVPLLAVHASRYKHFGEHPSKRSLRRSNSGLTFQNIATRWFKYDWDKL
jgi:hypothetical protein